MSFDPGQAADRDGFVITSMQNAHLPAASER
jgi:hypothetical protein